jgi:hypothetical protein
MVFIWHLYASAVQNKDLYTQQNNNNKKNARIFKIGKTTHLACHFARHSCYISGCVLSMGNAMKTLAQRLHRCALDRLGCVSISGIRTSLL